MPQPRSSIDQSMPFASRHIGPQPDDRKEMLSAIGVSSLSELIDQTLPASIRLASPAQLPEPLSEHKALETLKSIAARNQIVRSLIGTGYYDCITPAVIQRNVLENPGWYTAYTPYQAEIAQGRLEALLNWQQMVSDLTGLGLANASLLDEATAAAEAMTMAKRISKSSSQVFFVDEACFPQTIDVVRTRAHQFGFKLVIGPADAAASAEAFGILLQYPDAHGEIRDLTEIIGDSKAGGACVAVATDLMALVLLKSPGEMGADIALGSAQRFGIPMGFGGPHAAFFATRESNARSMPGRIIGVSRDVHGKPALRMALQTREQHIRREKANSNICTSQVLLANMAGMYAVYHGPAGLRQIANRIHRIAEIFAVGARETGFDVRTNAFFDTLEIHTGERTSTIIKAALEAGFNLRRISGNESVGMSFDETSCGDDLTILFRVFGINADAKLLNETLPSTLPPSILRSDTILSHPVFNNYHTEHEMLRYLKRLQNRDMALDHSMISLGSCTMKLNAAAEMMPITWPEFAHIHPFAPRDQVEGYREMIEELADYLRAITGFPAISMQPNSGAQGEYAGLLTIRRYQASLGQGHRNVCLIPKSAHGTNPASAQMCGLTVVVVNCDEHGNVDLPDLHEKIGQYRNDLSVLMITYPSTHGVFEADIREICIAVHEAGGQVYMDGANLNAQVGLTSPAFIGADVTHINLHKTFCIPHGGGGPGMGPIGVAAHLAPFMADHIVSPTGPEDRPNAGQGAVSAAPFGSASILPISWMYVRMMGMTGLTQATRTAILNANYIVCKLKEHYPVLYTGSQGRVAHECILDIRPIKTASGISEVDIAKRLMDYGFHAPTMSFPVAGTIMVEPTESESQRELDRFIAAMISIREEIRRIENGELPRDDNPLKNAPHTQEDVISQKWTHPYSRDEAVFPLPYLRDNKFWPFVNRIDDVFGDRHLFCTCPPMENY